MLEIRNAKKTSGKKNYQPFYEKIRENGLNITFLCKEEKSEKWLVKK